MSCPRNFCTEYEPEFYAKADETPDAGDLSPAAAICLGAAVEALVFLVLTGMFVLGKLVDVLSCSWIWVLSPLWVPLVGILVTLILVFAFTTLGRKPPDVQAN